MQFRSVWPLLVLLVLGAGLVDSAAAQDTLRHAEEQATSDHYQHRFDNPARYAEDWNDPARDRWQNPEAVLEAMGVAPGMTVADLGTGTGYFVGPLARAVGPEGTVLAVDIEPAMLDYVAEWVAEKGLGNVDTVLAEPSDTHLRPSSVDRILTVNTWHHIPNRTTYAEHLAGRLTEDGSLWVIDFTAEAPMGPPTRHRLAPQTVVRELEQGGFDAEVRDLGLPHQFVVVGRPR